MEQYWWRNRPNTTPNVERIASGSEKCDFLHRLLDNFKSGKAYITFRVVCTFHKIWNCSTMTSFIWLIWSISSSSLYFFFPSWPSRLYAGKYPWVKGCGLAWGWGVLWLDLQGESDLVGWQVAVASGSVPMIQMWLTQRVQAGILGFHKSC